MSKKYKNVCIALNYIEQLMILVASFTAYVSVYDFSSLVGIPIGIARFAVGLKYCALTAVIKKTSQLVRKKKDA